MLFATSQVRQVKGTPSTSRCTTTSRRTLREPGEKGPLKAGETPLSGTKLRVSPSPTEGTPDPSERVRSSSVASSFSPEAGSGLRQVAMMLGSCWTFHPNSLYHSIMLMCTQEEHDPCQNTFGSRLKEKRTQSDKSELCVRK